MTTALVGLHATDPATPYLSLWARIPGFQVGDLDSALYQRRSVLKHLAMRRTLWVLTAADLPAVQAAASDRVAGNERRKLVADAQKAGLTEDGDTWLDTACEAVLRHLTEHGPTSAKELARGATATGRALRPGPRQAVGWRNSRWHQGF